jgi:hypothetical protein
MGSKSRIAKFSRLTLTNDQVLDTLSDFKIDFATTVGTNSEMTIKSKTFSIIPKLETKSRDKTFNNSTFVVWDIETIGYGNVNNFTPEVPIMTG